MAQPQTIRWGAWHGDADLPLAFPDDWQVTRFAPADAPSLDDDALREALLHPLGTPPVAELARQHRDAVIVVDDLSRPTPSARLLPLLLEELNQGGITDDRIVILIGVATHRPLIRDEIILKIGAEAFRRLPVYNHFAWENCAHIGKTSYGTPVYVNRQFLNADLKICVGAILPHSGAGFGGGAKLVMPGVAGVETIYFNHGRFRNLRGGVNVIEGNEVRDDMEQVARLAGLDLIVNCVLNTRREVSGLFVGDLVQAHRAGVDYGRKVYATPVPENWDVAVFSAYPKDTEFVQAGMGLHPWQTARRPLVHEQGSIVLCSASPEGIGYHGLMGPEMRLGPHGGTRRPGVDRDFVILCPTIHLHDFPLEMRKDVTLCSTWEEVVGYLRMRHGSGARCGVFPCAAMQLAIPSGGPDAS